MTFYDYLSNIKAGTGQQATRQIHRQKSNFHLHHRRSAAMPRFLATMSQSDRIRELRRLPKNLLYNICEIFELDFDEYDDHRSTLAYIIDQESVINTDDRDNLYVQDKDSGTLVAIRVIDIGACAGQLTHFETIPRHRLRDYFRDIGLVGVRRLSS
jgi:hypothetical protein